MVTEVKDNLIFILLSRLLTIILLMSVFYVKLKFGFLGRMK